MVPQENLVNVTKSHQTVNVRHVKSLSAQMMIRSDHSVHTDREAVHSTLTRLMEFQPVLTEDPSSPVDLVVQEDPEVQAVLVDQEVPVDQEVVHLRQALVHSGQEDLVDQEAQVVQADPEVQVV